MRLRRLQLRRYGCFDDQDIALATEPGRLTMIVAPNGAGKSVLRRAFHDLLFDIPVQSPMKFRHGYPGMALHAEAIDADGTAFEFGWVRGGKPSRVTTDQGRFAALQRGVTPHQLEQLFALDTGGLRRGGTDLKGGATLAGALLAGTGELASAKSVRAVIEKRRQENWGQGKSKPPLNAAASALDIARKKARAAVQRPEKREGQERDLGEQRRLHDAAKQERDAALAETRRLNRVALTRPHFQHLLEAREWLAAHPDAPALPAGLDQRLADGRAAVATARATHAGAQTALARAIETAGQIQRDTAAIRFADRLAALPGMLGEAEKTTKDVGSRRTEHAAKLDDLRTALRDIGSSVAEDEAGSVIPNLGLLAEARAAITREAGLRKAVELAKSRVVKARKLHAEAESAPDPAPPVPDGLRVLLAEIRSDRNPVQHAAETAEAARAAAAEVRRTLALVPGWTGTAPALRALALPSEAGFDRLDADRQAALAQMTTSQAHRADLTDQDDAARKRLASLREQMLPDTASIAAARALRDQGMRLVLRRAFSAAPGLEEESAYAGHDPIALVYERHVRVADELADRRTAELERVQEAEQLGRAIADRAGPLAQAEAAETVSARAFDAAVQAWAEAIAPLELHPASAMAELRAALGGRLRVIDAMHASETASGAASALQVVHEEWSTRLATYLGMSVDPLAGLLSHADALVTSAQAAERATAMHAAKLEAARRTLLDETGAQTEAEQALQQWLQGWLGLLDRLHRPADESPETLTAVLDGIAKLDQHYRAAMSLTRRIADMQVDLGQFEQTVVELAQDLGETPADTPAATARLLIARASKAADAQSAWRQAELGLQQAQQAGDEAQTGLKTAEQQLEAVVAACGAATAEEAEGRIAASRAYAEQIARRDAALRGLAEHGNGLSETVLRAESDAVPPEDIAVRQEAANEAVTEAGNRAEAEAVKLDQLKAALDLEADAVAAIDARADYEAAAAEFGRRLEEQLVLHLASTMLGEAMRTVEEGVGESSLARVSQAFAAVTDGAYGLETREGAEGEELHAVEHAYPQERKSLDELSEGTRDQLYLALRMVALREHCASASALPFIADDILQTFDDDRARATLRALSELSRELQVIVLTHHSHLERIASDMGNERVHLLRL